MMVKEYILQNWELILILLAFVISLMTSVFVDKKSTRRMYCLIGAIFVLSVCVFVEFYESEAGVNSNLRIVLMAIRYSATPFITALVIFTLIKKLRWYIFIPALALAIVNIISIFTGIVFGLKDDGTLQRGPLGYAPFIVAGLYFVFLVYLLIKRSNKRWIEIIPILFLSLAFISGLVLPFIFGTSYANIFCTTIAIALFAYHEFSILQLTKKDALTGLLNRQAYYNDISDDKESISALVSIDMNGLKEVNDNYGHAAGDEALVTIGLCFKKALKRNESGYRIGGDEFIIVCRRISNDDLLQLVDRIKKNMAETKYSCSIGYSYSSNGEKTIDEMLKESDALMYEAKEQYYKESGRERRKK